MRRRRRRKQRKIIIISSLTLLLIMTVGYAAFQTNINITAKGNILEKGITINELKNKVITTGDGLYKDTYETNRYIYRGATPDNYIEFNGELWRIISIENDNTLKIIKQQSITSMVYDPGYTTSIEGITNANSMEGTRYTSDNTDYCYYSSSTTSYYGCNVWGSKTTMLDANGNNITKMPKQTGNSTTYNLPDKEAYINTYLNETYYNSLSENIQNKITTHIFNVGLLDYTSGQTLTKDISLEKTYTWKGKIGLANATDYVRASTDSSCTSAYVGSESPYPCKNGNFLFNSTDWWTMTPRPYSYSYYVWLLSTSGRLSGGYTANYSNYGVRPTVYIKSNILLKGKGTETNPYIINS